MNIQKLEKYCWDNVATIGVYEDVYLNDYCEYRKCYKLGGEYHPGRNLFGFRIPNYKFLCKLLDVPDKGGNQKKANLKELKRYVDYERDRNAYIIKPICDLSDEVVWGTFTTKKRPLLFYLKNGLYKTGMDEVSIKFDNGEPISSEYYTDLNEFILIDDLYNFGSRCYSENDLAKMFQYINYNYSRFTAKKKEVMNRTGISEKVVDKFFSLTKKSYTRIIKNSLECIEKKGWITVEKVLCGSVVDFSVKARYSKTRFDDEELGYSYSGNISYEKKELNRDELYVYQGCIYNAIDKMRKANRKVNYNFEDEKGCKRFNYQQWLKFINGETASYMGLVHVKECYKITLTEKAKNEYFDTIVSDIYGKTVNNLYQNSSYICNLISNAYKRILKQMDEISCTRFWTGFRELSDEELKKVANYEENYNRYKELIHLFISIKEEDLNNAKKILYKPMSDEEIEKKKKERIEKNRRRLQEIQDIYFDGYEEIS